MSQRKQRLVPRVHPQRDLRLLAVAAEGALAQQDPGDESLIASQSHQRVSVSRRNNT